MPSSMGAPLYERSVIGHQSICHRTENSTFRASSRIYLKERGVTQSRMNPLNTVRPLTQASYLIDIHQTILHYFRPEHVIVRTCLSQV